MDKTLLCSLLLTSWEYGSHNDIDMEELLSCETVLHLGQIAGYQEFYIAMNQNIKKSLFFCRHICAILWLKTNGKQLLE